MPTSKTFKFVPWMSPIKSGLFEWPELLNALCIDVMAIIIHCQIYKMEKNLSLAACAFFSVTVAFVFFSKTTGSH